MATTLRIGYTPHTSTTVLVDRLFGRDVYHCDAYRATLDSGHRIDSPAGYGLAEMCALSGRATRPGYAWDHSRGCYSRTAYGDLHQVATRLRHLRDHDNYRSQPYVDPTAAPRSRAAAIVRETCTARSILSSAWGRQLTACLGHKTWSADCDEWMPRSVQREIRAILLARAQRRADRKTAEAARVAAPGRIVREAATRKSVRAAQAAARKEASARKRLLAGQTGRAALANLIHQGTYLEQVSAEADGLVRSIVRAVGTIGEQAQSDLSEMTTGERFSGKKGRHHRLSRTTVCRVERLADWSAVLLTLRDYESFGSSNWGQGDRGYGSRGGSSYRCYLIVRDTTTGEAHLLRVPPKFGNADTQYFRRFAKAADRIHAAVAWTFGRQPSEYRPQVEA